MVVGTALGIFFVPLFFALIRGWLAGRGKPKQAEAVEGRAADRTADRTAELGGH
jgi:hypothetical protein